MMSDQDRPELRDGEVIDLDEPEDTSPAPGAAAPEPPAWAADGPMYVDVDGNIHVHGGRFFASRVVGSVKGMEAEAVIGGLVERFRELEDRFENLRKEVRGTRNRARALKSLRSFIRWVEGASAVGDFPRLLGRAHALADELEGEVSGSRSARRSLVERAEELATSTQWRSTGEAMDQLMEAWKQAGSAGGEEDEALWQRFRAARKTFFDRRSRHSSDLRRQRAAASEAKETLISRAEGLAASRDWDATSKAMDDLMDEWKQAGSVGRKADDELWQRFRDAREPFYAARRDHAAAQRRAQARPRPQGRAPRPPRGSERPRPPQGDRRPAGSGPLRASLAELVGPLRDLYPAARPEPGSDEPGGGTGKKTRGKKA